MGNALHGEPVLVDCPRGGRTVRIRPAFRVDETTWAVVESVGWEQAGVLLDTHRLVDGKIRKLWKAISEGGAVVEADTRAKAIAALLVERGEYEVTIEQTIPRLF